MTLPSIPPVCRNCGAAVDTTGAFCWKCGVPLKTGREPFIPAHVPTPPPTESSPEWTGVHVAGVHAQQEEIPTVPRRRLLGSRGGIVGPILLLVGIALLIVALFVGWYGISATGSAVENGHPYTVSASATFYPLDQYSLSFSCSGSDCFFTSVTNTGSYSQGPYSNLGSLYDAVTALVLAGIFLGAIAAFLAFTRRGRDSRWISVVLILAILMAAIAPMVPLAAQPSLLQSQSSAQNVSTSNPSPDTSFFGSCSGSSCGASLQVGETASGSWGPSIGWYLSLLGAVSFVVGWWFMGGRRSRAGRGPNLAFSN
jgi:hypothetical protein